MQLVTPLSLATPFTYSSVFILNATTTISPLSIRTKNHHRIRLVLIGNFDEKLYYTTTVSRKIVNVLFTHVLTAPSLGLLNIWTRVFILISFNTAATAVRTSKVKSRFRLRFIVFCATYYSCKVVYRVRVKCRPKKYFLLHII